MRTRRIGINLAGILSLSLAYAAISICLLGCAKTPVDRTIHVLLFDYSGSTNIKAARDEYVANTDLVFSKMKAGDVICGCLISDESFAKESIIFGPYDLPWRNPVFESKRVFNKKLKDEKDKAIRSARNKLLHQHEFPPTDILTSLLTAERLFDKYPSHKRVLVVMSDMFEQSTRYDFMKIRLTDKKISEIISAERAAERLSDLHGAEVYVAGAGAGTSEKSLQVRKFWLEYFNACGANLEKHNYGRKLIL
jgi:hypothetical protein